MSNERKEEENQEDSPVIQSKKFSISGNERETDAKLRICLRNYFMTGIRYDSSRITHQPKTREEERENYLNSPDF